MSKLERILLYIIAFGAVLVFLIAYAKISGAQTTEIVYETSPLTCTRYDVPVQVVGPAGATCIEPEGGCDVSKGLTCLLGCAVGPTADSKVTITVPVSAGAETRIQAFSYSTSDFASALKSLASAQTGILRRGVACSAPQAPMLLSPGS